MNRLIRPSFLITLIFSFALAAVLADEISQPVKLAEVPAPAQKFILEQKNKPHHQLGEIEKVTEDNETRYEVELIQGRRSRSFSVSPEGKLLSWQVFMNEVPSPVRARIRAQVETSKSELGDIDRVVEDGKTHFDAELIKGSVTNSFSVSPEGKLLSQEITWAETPAAVKKTISLRAGDGAIKKIEKNIDEDDGEISYDVTVQKNTGKTSFTLDENGVVDQ